MPKKTIEEMTRTELVRELEMSRETTRRMTPLPADSEQLIHDLQVHKIELEMQNRELRAAQALLEESRSRYADLYDFAPIGYLTLDGSGVIREINLTGAAMLGVPRERLVGRPFVSVVSMPSAEPFRRHLARCAEREPRVVSELTFSVRGRGPVIVQAVSVAAEPEAQRGAPAFRTALVDISALKAWEGKLGFLADVGEVLAGSLDVRTTLAAVVQLAVPALADVCAADVVDDEGRLERLDVACSPPADQDVLVGRLDRFAALVDGARFHDSILQSGRPLLFLAPLAAAKTPIAPDEPLERQAFRASGFSSVMVVPLATRGRSIGILTLVAAGSGRRYTEADLALASDLGRRAAAAIDNAHLHATARRAVGARDHVLALVAHDLRNPLHSIGMRLDLLEQRSPPSERQPETHKTIGAVRRAVAMMERLTSDLLDLAASSGASWP